MIVMVINISGGFALDFSFDSPVSVEINEEFDVVINAETNETYDVKIFVYRENKDRGNLISEIYSDGAWKDSYYYLQDIFPQESTFKNRVVESQGNREICVRLRLAEQSSFDELCKAIEITDESQGSGNQNSQPEPDEPEIPVEPLVVDNKKEDLINENKINPIQTVKKKIVLNSPSTNSVEEDSGFYMSKQEKVRRGVIYSFIGFLGVLVILLALKKL
ncbi:MAG: hypothetical protein Q8P57_04785 [Candidatus Pacearchaeota archaeon]|nr:hypothetical protein [Candidatus Pacearchaeota archaeon]